MYCVKQNVSDFIITYDDGSKVKLETVTEQKVKHENKEIRYNLKIIAVDYRLFTNLTKKPIKSIEEQIPVRNLANGSETFLYITLTGIKNFFTYNKIDCSGENKYWEIGWTATEAIYNE